MKTYIYPTYTPSRDKSGNLYIKYFHDSFKADASFEVVNRFWQIGIGSLAFNLDAELLIIQWVDLVPGKRLGKIQFVFFLILMMLSKLMNKKIIWILHNKSAHQGKSKFVDIGMNLMANVSTVVFAHSKEGITFFNEKYPKYKGKCYYIPHPVYSQQIIPSKNLVYDYIIWGNISKRKNILDFIQYAVSCSFFENKKIIICGNCPDKGYDQKIRHVISLQKNITYINKFISDEELASLIAESRSILFTYNTESVLSSGALVYSLNFCKPIIGPDAGSFKDEPEIVCTYKNFSDIPKIELSDNTEACREYIKNNGWKAFPQKVLSLMR